MAEAANDTSTWPADGATLEEVRQRVDPALLEALDAAFAAAPKFGADMVDTSVLDLSWRQKPGVAEFNAAVTAVDRQFLHLIKSCRVKGRRGSPTAAHSEIPADAWPHVKGNNYEASMLTEPDGTRWYDVRAWPSTPAQAESKQQAGTPAAKSAPDWLGDAVKTHTNVPEMISAFAKMLFNAMQAAFNNGEVRSCYKNSKTIETLLKRQRLWPVKKRTQPNKLDPQKSPAKEPQK